MLEDGSCGGGIFRLVCAALPGSKGCSVRCAAVIESRPFTSSRSFRIQAEPVTYAGQILVQRVYSNISGLRTELRRLCRLLGGRAPEALLLFT